jgi:hypothetical protein
MFIRPIWCLTAYDPSYLSGRDGEDEIYMLGKKLVRPHLNKWAEHLWVVCAYNPSYVGGQVGRSQPESGLRQKLETLSKK